MLEGEGKDAGGDLSGKKEERTREGKGWGEQRCPLLCAGPLYRVIVIPSCGGIYVRRPQFRLDQ